MSHYINNIPKHWQVKRLAEVCDEIFAGGDVPKDNFSLVKNNEYQIPIYANGEKENGLYGYTNISKVNPPSVTISARGTIGYTLVRNHSFFPIVRLIVLKPKNDINTSFLKYAIDNCNIKHTGSSIPQLTVPTVKTIQISIPPLPEQQAIVAKIEELLSDLENGKQQLLKAQQQLKVYRQSLLKWAFEGKLTKIWREVKANLPTAHDLLMQIESGREAFYKNQLNEWEKDFKLWLNRGQIGKKPSKPKALTKPDKPNVQQNEKKWDIPKNWIWTQMGALCFVTKLAGFEYTDYVKYDDNGDLPVLKAENVGQLGFKETIFSKVKTESIKMLTRSQLFGGELLIVFVGAGTGNVAMVPFNHKYFLGPNIGMARPYFKINSKYLELFFQSLFGKSLMLSTVKAVAQPSLSMATIRQTPIAFPSIEEQAKIVDELESKLTVCDKIEETIAQSLQQVEMLKQSILKRAFEGKLI